jgi:tetratricopeptide (TPR) repeat protein
MKLLTTTAIALAAGLIAVPAAAQYAPGAPNNTMSGATPAGPPATAVAPEQPQAQSAQPSIKLSSKAGKAIIELQKAVNANDVANIPAKLAAAQALAQTKDDRYAIARMQLNAAVAAKDYNAAAAAVDAIAASGLIGGGSVAELYDGVGIELYNAKQYAQSAAVFQKAATLNPQNPQPLKLLAEARNSQGQHAEGAAALLKALQLSAAAGQKPEEALYKRAVAMAYDAKSPSAVEIGRQWVAAYPGPDSWHNSLAIYRNLNNPDPAIALDILRLSRATNSMQGTGDYHIYAYEAANQANYGEAKSLIAEGLAAGKIKASDPVVQEIQGALKGKTAPTAAELAAAEQGAKVPSAFIHVGDRYYGANNYQKAAELYTKALAKGADANLANLRLGEALARAGDKPGATAALNKVGGSLAEIAKFWLGYVQHG